MFTSDMGKVLKALGQGGGGEEWGSLIAPHARSQPQKKIRVVVLNTQTSIHTPYTQQHNIQLHNHYPRRGTVPLPSSKKGEWAYTPNLCHEWGAWPVTGSKQKFQKNKIFSVQHQKFQKKGGVNPKAAQAQSEIEARYSTTGDAYDQPYSAPIGATK